MELAQDQQMYNQDSVPTIILIAKAYNFPQNMSCTLGLHLT